MNRKTVLIALVVSLTAAWLASLFFKKGDSASSGRTVLVAAQDIPERMVLSENLFVRQAIPKEMHNPNMVGKLDPRHKVYANGPVGRGEILYKNRLSGTDTEPELSYMIDREQGAVTIGVSAVTGVGILKPGDHVDVYSIYDLQSRSEGADIKPAVTKRIVSACRVLVVQDQVMAPVKTGSNFGRPRVVVANIKRVTLAANDEDIKKIILAHTRGSIHLALRQGDDKATGEQTAYSTLDMSAELFPSVQCIRADKVQYVRVDR
ncbi:Flp pilus assembly protein CpaB [bacterium]|nr:Flp pilus assembly protein CpaB [bacterium]